jgi:hypothetical protein
MLVFSAPRCLVVKANVVPAKISPEVVLLLVQTSHHAIAFAAFAAQLEHAESLADTALLASKFVLDGLVVATAELLVETSTTAEASGGFGMLLVLGLCAEETVSAALFFALTLALAERAAEAACGLDVSGYFLGLGW